MENTHTKFCTSVLVRALTFISVFFVGFTPYGTKYIFDLHYLCEITCVSSCYSPQTARALPRALDVSWQATTHSEVVCLHVSEFS